MPYNEQVNQGHHMFTSEELQLISYGLIAMKDLAEVDLMITDDEDFLSKVKSEIIEIDSLSAKVKSLM